MIYFDYAGGTPICNSVKKILANYYIPKTAFRNNNSNTGEEIIINLKEKLKKIFNANKFNIYIGTSATSISNFLANSINDFNTITSSSLEHHSSFLPWLLKCKNNSKKFIFSDNVDYLPIFNKKSDIFLITYISNITGNCFINEIKKLRIDFPESIIIVDGAQTSGIIPNLDNLNCDAFYFSSQKMYSIPGTGILFVSEKLDLKLQDSLVGGGKNLNDKFETRYKDKLLVGTPNMLSIECLLNTDFEYIDNNDYFSFFYDLGKQLNWELITNLKTKQKSIFSFFPNKLNNLHTHDISSLLLEHNIIIRDGNMCCSKFFNNINNNIIRFSIGKFTTQKEINFLEKILLKKIHKLNNIN
jgi:selenocysteine lyase/cysteine desulfurase